MADTISHRVQEMTIEDENGQVHMPASQVKVEANAIDDEEMDTDTSSEGTEAEIRLAERMKGLLRHPGTWEPTNELAANPDWPNVCLLLLKTNELDLEPPQAPTVSPYEVYIFPLEHRKVIIRYQHTGIVRPVRVSDMRVKDLRLRVAGEGEFGSRLMITDWSVPRKMVEMFDGTVKVSSLKAPDRRLGMYDDGGLFGQLPPEGNEIAMGFGTRPNILDDTWRDWGGKRWALAERSIHVVCKRNHNGPEEIVPSVPLFDLLSDEAQAAHASGEKAATHDDLRFYKLCHKVHGWGWDSELDGDGYFSFQYGNCGERVLIDSDEKLGKLIICQEDTLARGHQIYFTPGQCPKEWQDAELPVVEADMEEDEDAEVPVAGVDREKDEKDYEKFMRKREKEKKDFEEYLRIVSMGRQV